MTLAARSTHRAARPRVAQKCSVLVLVLVLPLPLPRLLIPPLSQLTRVVALVRRHLLVRLLNPVPLFLRAFACTLRAWVCAHTRSGYTMDTCVLMRMSCPILGNTLSFLPASAGSHSSCVLQRCTTCAPNDCSLVNHPSTNSSASLAGYDVFTTLPHSTGVPLSPAPPRTPGAGRIAPQKRFHLSRYELNLALSGFRRLKGFSDKCVLNARVAVLCWLALPWLLLYPLLGGTLYIVRKTLCTKHNVIKHYILGTTFIFSIQ